jgi:hypothetical protein
MLSCLCKLEVHQKGGDEVNKMGNQSTVVIKGLALAAKFAAELIRQGILFEAQGGDGEEADTITFTLISY